MRNYITDEQREAVVWAIAEAAESTEELLDWGMEAWGENWREHWEMVCARLQTLRQLADDWGAKSAVNDCESCLREIEPGLKRKPGRETRAAGAAARKA